MYTTALIGHRHRLSIRRGTAEQAHRNSSELAWFVHSSTYESKQRSLHRFSHPIRSPSLFTIDWHELLRRKTHRCAHRHLGYTGNVTSRVSLAGDGTRRRRGR